MDAITERNLRTYDSDWSAREYARDGLTAIEAEMVARRFPPSGKILDLGCGAGRTTVALHQLGYQVVGIDLSERLLAIARARHPELDLRTGDAARLDFPDGAFDGVLFSYNGIDEIHPRSARLACMKEAWRVLRPGGSFLFSSHNLVGHLFSGGFFYLRGLVNGLRLLGDQLRNREIASWYVRYADEGGPELLVYSGPPARTVAQLRSVGFEAIEVLASGGERRRSFIDWRCPHPHYGARRPTAAR